MGSREAGGNRALLPGSGRALCGGKDRPPEGRAGGSGGGDDDGTGLPGGRWWTPSAQGMVLRRVYQRCGGGRRWKLPSCGANAVGAIQA